MNAAPVPAETTDESIRSAYESDASGWRLRPDSVARPVSADEVLAIVRCCAAEHRAITAAGGQTSTTAASICDRGTLLSLRGMDRVLDIDPVCRTMRVQPGALVGDIKRAAASENLLFAPDPTSEDECTIGGAIACNASGARTLKYGAVRAHVTALRVALAHGSIVDVRRSATDKNTAGYAFAQEAIDWFIGSEGTLGIIVEAELALLPLPEHVIGLAVPFSCERDALSFVVAARESALVRPRCIEYFDGEALSIARTADDQDGWALDARALVYVEQELAVGGSSESGESSTPDAWLALSDANAGTGDVRVFDGEAQLRRARKMRHAVPATMNERGSRCTSDGGRKVSTDWAVPYPKLLESIGIAREIAEQYGLPQPVIYGHAGNGHPHENFIARNRSELHSVEAAVEATLRRVIAMGGTVSAEHGIGKLKRRWLPLQLSPMQLGVMRAVKRELDPQGTLAPGNIL